MSLLSDFMTPCVMLDRTTRKDGYGGYTSVWQEGAEFDATVILDTSMQARIAEKQGVTGLYTVTTKKAMNLQYRDVFKRLSDNKVFRVTSDGDDKATPNSASLNMRQVTAEEYTPTGEISGG